MTDKPLIKLDLLAVAPVRALVRRTGFPLLFQLGTLAALVVLMVMGFGQGLGHSDRELMLFRKTHLTTLVVWGLWWPGMIAAALLLGRVWCTVCPLELVNRLGDAVARRIGYSRAPLGKLLRAGWLSLAVYLVMQVLVAGISMHRVPHTTAVMLAALLGTALFTGLTFRHPRSFCAGFCPAAALLSVYGRFTPLQLSKRDGLVCRECETKDCTDAVNRYNLDGRSCPSLLRPHEHAPSDGCVLCLQCAKVCPHDNMGFGVVDAAAPARRQTLLRPFEAAFVMIALGFVAHEVVGEVKWLDRYFHLVPAGLQALAPGVSFGWVEAAWFLVLFPLLVWTLIGGASSILGHRGGLRALLLGAATGAAPVVALAHLAKATAKVASWAGYLPLALADPLGGETFRAITDDRLAAPAPLAPLTILGWVALLALGVTGWRAWRWARRLPAGAPMVARVGLLSTAVFFSAVLVFWVWPIR